MEFQEFCECKLISHYVKLLSRMLLVKIIFVYVMQLFIAKAKFRVAVPEIV